MEEASVFDWLTLHNYTTLLRVLINPGALCDMVLFCKNNYEKKQANCKEDKLLAVIAAPKQSIMNIIVIANNRICK